MRRGRQRVCLFAFFISWTTSLLRILRQLAGSTEYFILFTITKEGTGMNLQQMKYVVMIAEQGSFSRASQVLYITQPTLSNEVKKLEKELGITIFSRNKHSVQVTDAGRGISGMFELAKFLYKRLADRISPKKELRNIHFRGSFYIVKNYGIPFFLAIDKHS